MANKDSNDFNSLTSILTANPRDKGANKDYHGKNANHMIVKVSHGRIIRNSTGQVVGDLSKEEMMFVAARGGAGGKGIHFFASTTNVSPNVCEQGAKGEDIS
jgi:GTPase